MHSGDTLRDPSVVAHLPAPFDLNGLKTYDLESRPSRIFADDFGQPMDGDGLISAWLTTLPRAGAGLQLNRLRERICAVQQTGRTFIVALGAEAIENGCGPYVADWIQKKVVTAVALTGVAAIAEFELAVCGKTGEDFAAGGYGAARETADAFAVAARSGAVDDMGLGTALGGHMESLNCARDFASVIQTAYQCAIPCTIHVSLGAEVVHMHPHVSGSSIGASTLIDFRRLCSVMADAAHGVCLNLDRSAYLPNVIHKAIAVARNFGHSVDGLFAASICPRPREHGPEHRSFECIDEDMELVGQCELIVPLLHAAVGCELGTATPIRPGKAA